MSTEYRIAEGGRVALSVLEHSGRFDLDVDVSTPPGGKYVAYDHNFDEGCLTVAAGLDAEQLAEVGLKVLQAVLYNVADPAEVKRWLHARLDEVDFSGTRTPYPTERRE